MRTADSSAIIAELNPTPALHSIASRTPLNPKFAVGALFEFGACYEIHKFLIILPEALGDLILFAVHPFVIVALAT